jgi:hypothetical protein
MLSLEEFRDRLLEFDDDIPALGEFANFYLGASFRVIHFVRISKRCKAMSFFDAGLTHLLYELK